MFIYACFNYAYSCLVGFALQRFLKKTKLCGKLLIQNIPRSGLGISFATLLHEIILAVDAEGSLESVTLVP